MRYLFNTAALFLAVVLGSASCESAGDQITHNAAAAQSKLAIGKNAPDGMAVFRQYCITCHGADGKLGLSGAKDLSISTLTVEERVNNVTNGKKMMPPFNEVLSPEEIKAVVEYTLTLKK